MSTGFRTRLLTLLPTFVLGTTLAMFASGDFSANLSAFISLLLLLLIPWGAVNLVDFYLVQHGTYDVSAMYARKGPYWENRRTWTVRGVSWKVMASYVIGVAAGFPFAANSWFTGPLAERLGGGDVSWIPGLLVTTAVYVALVSLSRGQPSVAPPPTSTPPPVKEPPRDHRPVVLAPDHEGHHPDVEVQCGRPIPAFDTPAAWSPSWRRCAGRRGPGRWNRPHAGTSTPPWPASTTPTS